MLESLEEAAERILAQAMPKPGPRVFYVAFGNSLKFITFARAGYAYQIYGNDAEKLVGLYTHEVSAEQLVEDMRAYLDERGFKQC